MLKRGSNVIGVSLALLFCAVHNPRVHATELVRTESAMNAIAAAWRDVVSGVPDPRLDHAEKTARIDRLFLTLKRAGEIDGDAVLAKAKDLFAQTDLRRPLGGSHELVLDETSIREALGRLGALARENGFEKEWASVRRRVDAQAELPFEGPTAPREEATAGTEKVAGASNSAAEDFITDARKFINPERLKLALDLFRKIIALEERRIFVLLTDHDNRPLQAHALAELAADLNFLGRQGLALVRLFQIGTSTFTSVRRDAGDDDGLTEGEVKKIFDEAFPKLLRSIDDLGLYYAKLIQSFSGIIYHFDPAAYEKLDRFMGMMPRKMSWQQVKTILEEDLGRPLGDAFVSVEREPFANGSMGQIHNAILRDAEGAEVPVVVKVQKDFVKKELAWNMNTNSIFFDFLEGISPEEYRWMVHLLTSQAVELGHTFDIETDSVLEAKQQRFFRRMLRPVAHHGVPRVFATHSGARVITSERIEGAQRIHTAFAAPEARRPPHPAFATRRPAEDDEDEADVEEGEPEAAEEAAAEGEEAAAEGEDVAGDQDETARGDEADARPTEEKIKMGRLLLRLAQTYGYRLSPTYFQVLRLILPIVGTSLQFGKMQDKFAKAGLDGFDAEVQRLDRITKAYERAVIYQLFYAKELHADYNFGNALVDRRDDLWLIDFGASVATKGLVLNPLFVALGFAKGDAEVVLKRLIRMGEFADLGRDRAAILAEISTTINTYEIPRRSWPGFAWNTWKEWRGRKKPKVAVQSPAENDRVLEAVDKHPSMLDMMKGAEPEIGGVTPEAQAISAAARAGLSFGGTFLRMIPAYPYHRTRVQLLRTSFCQKLLGDKE